MANDNRKGGTIAHIGSRAALMGHLSSMRPSKDQDFDRDGEELRHAIGKVLDEATTKMVSRANLAMRTVTPQQTNMVLMNVLAQMLAVMLWEGAYRIRMPFKAIINAYRSVVTPVVENQLRKLYNEPPYDPAVETPAQPFVTASGGVPKALDGAEPAAPLPGLGGGKIITE